MIEAVIWDYDGTLVDTRQKNLDVTKEIVFEVLNKSYEEFPALLSLENYEKANSRSANWRDLYSREFLMNEEQTNYAGSLWTKYQLLNKSVLELYRGLREIIIELGINFQQGIVSLNSHENIRKSLSHNKRRKLFQCHHRLRGSRFCKTKTRSGWIIKMYHPFESSYQQWNDRLYRRS